MILIGGRALKHHYPSYNKRSFSSDYDLIVSSEHVGFIPNDAYQYLNKRMFHAYGCLYEIETDNEPGSSNKLILDLADSATWSEIELPIKIKVKVAPVEVLFAITAGSLYCPKFWSKHIIDYHFLKQQLSSSATTTTVMAAVEQIIVLRREETNKRYNIDDRINLNMTNDEFFKQSADKVHRIIEHDKIHELVKYNAVPLHETLKNNKNSALISQKLFWQADKLTRLQLVREEAMAIAIERFLLPSAIAHSVITYKDSLLAYRKALGLICTTLTKGFFRQYANDHYPELSIPDKDLSELVNNLNL